MEKFFQLHLDFPQEGDREHREVFIMDPQTRIDPGRYHVSVYIEGADITVPGVTLVVESYPDRDGEATLYGMPKEYDEFNCLLSELHLRNQLRFFFWSLVFAERVQTKVA